MPNNTLDYTLGDVLNEIRRGLAVKLRLIVNKELSKVNRQKGLDRLMKKREDLESLIHTSSVEIRKINQEIQEKEGVIRDILTDDESSLMNAISISTTQSSLEAIRASLTSVEARNYLNFKKIENNTQTMFRLAITQKEKRGIIISLQQRDWRCLGIELPQLPHFEQFTIENGEIAVPKMELLESK